jgi:hypothetical protein
MKRRLAVAGAVAAALLAVPAPAHAITAQQCIDAHTNPNGSIATQCHQAGWTVNSYIVVDPALWVRWTNLRECRDEFGTSLNPCSWNFGAPPSAGDKYWFDVGGHRHNVNGIRWGA